MDCPLWPQLDLADLSKEMQARLPDGRHPFSGTFELTDRCNLGCVHCYINQPAGSVAARAKELTAAQTNGILDQIADAGCLFLLLTGGEPLLRPDFGEIYLHAVRRGLLLTLYTNGTLLNARVADLLAEWRPRRLEITLYGATRETYERVTGVAGSYAACLGGIELALVRGLPLALKTMVLRANRDELEAMRAMAAAWGVAFRYDAMLWPRYDGGHGPYAQQLSAEEVVALDIDDPARSEEWRQLQQLAHGAGGSYVFACGAGRGGFHVNSAGMLSLCMSAPSPAYDLLQGSFQDGWDRVLGSAIRQVYTRDTSCRHCAISALCLQCPGWSQAEHGDNETPVAFVCEVGRLRARRLVSS